MKILRLDLIAFGPFTNRTLDFSQGDHGLHLVYGPNEAGKSSSLRAIRQLLFGIPVQTKDNFLHPHRNLRIGAQLLDNDDRPCEVIRRKGREKTLRGADDIEVLAPEILSQMLSHIDQDAFCLQFGIGLEQLIAGGKQIAEGEGEAGSTLFAAAAGITGLNAVLENLNNDAKKLFATRGKNPRINQSLDELKAAKKRIKEASLPSDEWTRHHEALQTAISRKQEIQHELEQAMAERSRLDRIGQALPIVPSYVQLKEEAIQLADAPQLADDFSESRRQAMSDLSLAVNQQKSAQQTIDRRQAEIDNLDSPGAILDEADRIEEIATELGVFQKGKQDLPGLIGQRKLLESEILAAMNQLGGQAETARRLIRPNVKVQIRELAAKRQSLDAKQEAAIARLRDVEPRLAAVCRDIAQLPTESPDIALLQRTMRDIEGQGAIEKQLADAQQQQGQLQEQAAIDLQRLGHWAGTLDTLEQLAIPTRECVEYYDEALCTDRSSVDRTAKDLESLEVELREKEAQLDRLEHEQHIPSEEDLKNARQQRALLWRLVRETLQQNDVNEQEIQSLLEKFPSAENLTEAFEQSVEAADAIADRLRREAEAVSQQAALRAEQARLSQRIDQGQRALAEATTAAQEKQQQWEAICSAINVADLSPREMRDWIARQQELVSALQEIREQHDLVGQLGRAVDDSVRRLSEALSQMGEDLPPEGESLAMQLEYAREAIKRLTSTEQQRQTSRQDEARLQDEQADAQRSVDGSRQAFERWNAQWAQAIEPLDLASDASVDEANAILEAKADTETKIDKSTDLKQRIEGINADCLSFQAKVTAVCHDVANDLFEISEHSTERAVHECRKRLTAARKTETKLDELRQQQAEQREQLDAATTRRNEAEAKLNVLCREAGCESPDALQESENRADQRSTNSEKIERLDEKLLGLSAGKSIDEFITEVQAVEADQLPALIQQVKQQLDELNDEKSKVDAAIGSERTHLEKVDNSAEAARAGEDAEQLRASIAEDAEQYAKLRLASVVLQDAIERYRDKHQGPLLRRASELFSELTLGKFDELRADYDSRGNAALVGIRNGQQTSVGTAEMSDGTCDQLYLALRLASLELHFQSRPPIPFIVDDVLNRFDDDRAVAALKALGKLSSETQVIFFTHHEHLVRLAEENLDDDVLFIHNLESDEQPTEKVKPLRLFD